MELYVYAHQLYKLFFLQGIPVTFRNWQSTIEIIEIATPPSSNLAVEYESWVNVDMVRVHLNPGVIVWSLPTKLWVTFFSSSCRGEAI